MLGLTLRKEFQGRRLRGTAIELTNSKNEGAVQVPAAQFLEITYPSGDLLKALESVAPGHGRPVVLMGERGLGKSHMMAALHHALTDGAAARAWLQTWAGRLQRPEIAQIALRPGLRVVSESLHHQRYPFLWDILFKHHPRGQYFEGKHSAKGGRKAGVPSMDLLLEMLAEEPMALLLDEFQTWYDGLVEEPARPHRSWAFNFIQSLSEVAGNHPERLLLVVTVRSGETEAYQQLHRVQPIQVDFKGPTARRDRRRLLLHRLFENRPQVETSKIQTLAETHVGEFLRLYDVPLDERPAKSQEFLETWPYSPSLMSLLEDQVLVATEAQETRDLIRILAGLFKSRGESSPVLTAADFNLEAEENEIAALLESVSTEQHRALRDKALRNLQAVRDAMQHPEKPPERLAELLSSLWLRSLAVGKTAGAEPRALQLDLTRASRIDDNAFAADLDRTVENSFNIHRDGNRLVFREEENPQARLLAEARNDRLFADGSDVAELAKHARYALSGSEDVSRDFVVVVLGPRWQDAPWDGPVQVVPPPSWGDRLPLMVLPEAPSSPGALLGPWLKTHVPSGRNTVRFLYPKPSQGHLYRDRELLVAARAVLRAGQWMDSNPTYRPLHKKYKKQLEDALKDRFGRFAVLDRWNFQDPKQSVFHEEGIQAQGPAVPGAVETALRTNLFEAEVFEEFVATLAAGQQSVARLLSELREPRPNGEPCLPWLGETLVKERLVRLCARGRVALNLRGTETLQRKAGEDEQDAWQRMKGKLPGGKQLEEVLILPPVAEGATGTPGGASPTAAGNGGASATQDPVPPYVPVPAGGGGPPLPPPGGLFGGTPTAAAPQRRTVESAPNSPLNLLGQLEKSKVGPGTKVHSASLRVEGMSGAQLQDWIRKLPDGLRYGLSLEVEELA